MTRVLRTLLVTALVAVVGCDKQVLPSEPLAAGTLGSAHDLAANTYQSTDVPKAILDNRTVSSTIQVGSTGYVTKVTVRFNIRHTYDQDLGISLMSPSGKIVTLVAHRGGAGQNFTNTVLDDNATTIIAAGLPPFTGTFIPDESLAIFAGESAMGTWTLQVLDDASGDTGTLNDWSLTLTTTDQAPAPPAGITATFQSTDIPKNILNHTTATSTIQVPDIGTVTYVKVQFNIVHTFDGDLRISLSSPGGTVVRVLVDRMGGSGNNFTNTILDDNGPVAITSGFPPYAGTFRPGQKLGGFIGLSAQGTWTLTVSDMSGGDEGQLTSFSLTITALPANTAPVAAAGDQTVTRTSAAGANVTLDGTGSTDADNNIETYEWLENNVVIASGSAAQHVFALGTHTITLRVTDDVGAQSEDQAVITVQNSLPTAAAGVDQTVTRGSSAGANVALAGTGSDVDGTIETYQWFENDGLIASGSTAQHVFALGTHAVTLRVTDNDGAQSEDQVAITVDNSGPTAAAGVDQTVTRDSPAGANVTLAGTGSDLDGTIETYQWFENQELIASNSPAQHVFALGMHVVTLRVTDNDGAQSEDQVVITVRNSAPTVSINPPLTLECEAGGAMATFVANGADVDGDFTYAWSPTGATTAATSFFAPLGTTQVVVTVTDNLGESAQASSSVTVADTRRPAIFMMVSPTTLFPPNDAMVKVASDISASDACDPSPRLTVSVSSNEAPSNDWQIVANTDGTYDVYVRAAREGNGTGRIYTIRATATDASGNIFSKSQTVTVPHSQSNNQPKEKVSKAIRQ